MAKRKQKKEEEQLPEDAGVDPVDQMKKVFDLIGEGAYHGVAYVNGEVNVFADKEDCPVVRKVLKKLLPVKGKLVIGPRPTYSRNIFAEKKVEAPAEPPKPPESPKVEEPPKKEENPCQLQLPLNPDPSSTPS